VTQDLSSRPRTKRGFSAVPFFGDLVALSRLVRDRKAGWGPKLVAILAIVYVVSPVDAIPELIAPWIAWMDDVGLVLALRLLLSRRLEPYRYPLFEGPAVPKALPADQTVIASPVEGTEAAG
jgi:uncharacterized membrane protein YkvA (DUF1232 family)